MGNLHLNVNNARKVLPYDFDRVYLFVYLKYYVTFSFSLLIPLHARMYSSLSRVCFKWHTQVQFKQASKLLLTMA
jgi:hypothetical protein